MGLFDDSIDPSQFQDSGGLFGRLLSWLPQVSSLQAGPDSNPQVSSSDYSYQPPASVDAGNAQAALPGPDIGTRLGASLQSWAQTPIGSPFAALANGITGFNNVRPANAASASSSAPPASNLAQTPNLGDRLGAAFQNWALTPVGSPFAGLANGINGFNTGQTIVSPATLTAAKVQTPDNNNQANPAVQNQTAPAANAATNPPVRRLVAMRRWR